MSGHVGLEKGRGLPHHPFSHLLCSESLDLSQIAVDLGGLLSTVQLILSLPHQHVLLKLTLIMLFPT